MLVMIKQFFESWNKNKQEINEKSIRPHFREGEIRWAKIGYNIASELFGKGDLFLRPVLILKKIYGHSCIVVPLSSNLKDGSYYFNFTDSTGKNQCAIFRK